ncbi:MAG: hypothetical protein WC503_02425 [Candidatus Shapirobacteria bacterium]
MGNSSKKSRKKDKKGDGRDGKPGKILPDQPRHSVCQSVLNHRGKGPRNWCSTCNCRVPGDEVYYG